VGLPRSQKIAPACEEGESGLGHSKRGSEEKDQQVQTPEGAANRPDCVENCRLEYQGGVIGESDTRNDGGRKRGAISRFGERSIAKRERTTDRSSVGGDALKGPAPSKRGHRGVFLMNPRCRSLGDVDHITVQEKGSAWSSWCVGGKGWLRLRRWGSLTGQERQGVGSRARGAGL